MRGGTRGRKPGPCHRFGSRTGSFEGVTCIRLDATVVQAHIDKELAEPNFKGYPAADHLRLFREAIEALPPTLRRKIMVTCDGADASHELVKALDGSRPGTGTRSPGPQAGR